MKKNLPKVLTLQQAADKTGIPVVTLRGWLRRYGNFPAKRIKGRVFIDRNDFRDWLEVNSKSIAV